MKIGICDDEKEIRELLGNRVRKLYPEAGLLCYSSGEELLAGEQPDILLLDIQMAGKNGMEVAKELRRKSSKLVLIFVTAIEEYVFEAFDVGAFHYLVKPFAEEKLVSVLQQAVAQWQDTVVGSDGQESRFLMITAKGVHRKVSIDDIVYAEVFNRKVILHKLQEDIEYYGKMAELEKIAGEDFFRPHRAYLVNLKYVEKYDASTIYLEKGTALIAKKNYPEFVKRFLKYYQRRGKQK